MPSMDNRLPATIPKEGFYDMPHLLTTSYAETPAYTLRNPENDIWNLEPLQHRLYDITNQQLRSIDQTGPSPQQGYCALRNAVEMVRRKSLSSDEILRAIYASHDEESNDLEECSAEEIYPDASTAPVTPRKRLPDPVGTPALKSWEKKSGTSRAESCRQATSTPGSYGGRRPSETVTQECAESYGVRRLSQASIRESLRSYFDQSPSQTRRPSLESSGRQRLSEIETLDSSGFGSSFDSPEKIRIGPVNFTNPLLAAAVAAKAAAAYQDEDKNCAPGYAFKRSDDKYKEEILQVCEGLNDSLPRYSSSPAGKAPLHEQSTFQSHTCTSTRSRDSYLSRGGFDADDSSSSASAIDVAAQLHRHAAANNDATCTWSGMLPQSCKDNPVYSCKVFLGGVPWDITPGLLSHAFKNFGQVRIEFPGNSTPRLGRGRPISGSPQCHGYVYAIFDNDRAVQQMLQACDRDVKEETYFFKLSGKKVTKKVQVIPWNVNDSNYICHSTTQRLDNETTVFVGALHGMLTAEGLARVMNDLFGNVVYAGIDTDKHKYPIGSGRVTFSSHKSYMKAVNAAFVEIKSSKFAKKVQIDPYLEESLCTTCKSCVGLYFCRNMTCFKYYCERCWVRAHNSMDPSTGVHKPLSRNSKNPNLASALRNTPEIKALQVGCVKDSMSAHRLQS